MNLVVELVKYFRMYFPIPFPLILSYSEKIHTLKHLITFNQILKLLNSMLELKLFKLTHVMALESVFTSNLRHIHKRFDQL